MQGLHSQTCSVQLGSAGQAACDPMVTARMDGHGWLLAAMGCEKWLASHAVHGSNQRSSLISVLPFARERPPTRTSFLLKVEKAKGFKPKALDKGALTDTASTTA